MARALSDDAIAVIAKGGRYDTEVTVTAPGGTPVTVETSPGWSVVERAPVAGPRFGISGIQLLPNSSIDDLFDLIDTPGAIFDAKIGVNLGAQTEWCPVFHGYADDGSSRRNSLGVAMSLVDPWSWADEVEFESPFTTTATMTRASQIADLFTPVISALAVVTTADGGTITQPAVYTGRRSQAVTQLATDGLLQTGFDADGDLFIRAQPALNGMLTARWAFRTGTNDARIPDTALAEPPTIIAGTLERTRASKDRLVNAVRVIPGGDWQTWTAQTAKLADTSDRRHESRIGFRVVEITSNTIDDPCDALLLAQQHLTKLLRATAERVRLQVVLNPAVEADDVFSIAALPLVDDRGWNNTYIATSVTHSPATGRTTIEGVTASAYVLGL